MPCRGLAEPSYSVAFPTLFFAFLFLGFALNCFSVRCLCIENHCISVATSSIAVLRHSAAILYRSEPFHCIALHLCALPMIRMMAALMGIAKAAQKRIRNTAFSARNEKALRILSNWMIARIYALNAYTARPILTMITMTGITMATMMGRRLDTIPGIQRAYRKGKRQLSRQHPRPAVQAVRPMG